MRLLAAARERRERGETAALVAEILTGRPPRPLPASITAALDQFDELAAHHGGSGGRPEPALP